jgi:acyl-CoA thioesterase-1
MLIRAYAILVFGILIHLPVDAQTTRQTRPQFRPPDNIDPKLPNVLLIGDSISIGYMLPVRKMLEGEANVFRPATNCGPTTRGLQSLDEWLGDRKWDIIHWNFGLHDLKYLGPNGENLADPYSATSHQQVPPDDYARNIRQLAQRLKRTGATVVFCQTTPVPEGAKGRVVGDSKKYNEIAEEVMESVGGIEINRLYDFAIDNVENLPANVHYSEEGSKKLASQVANVIRMALAKRSGSQ